MEHKMNLKRIKLTGTALIIIASTFTILSSSSEARNCKIATVKKQPPRGGAEGGGNPGTPGC
jgi:hypothetical protein